MTTRRAFVMACGCALVSPAMPVLAHKGEEDGHTFLCAANGTAGWNGISGVGEPAPEAIALVNRLIAVSGLKKTIDVRAADFTKSWTAIATIKGGKRQIIYDRDKFNWGSGRASYAQLGVMAHEVGHHLASHVYVRESPSQTRELEADRFAGHALALLGASITQAQEMFRKDWGASSTHPGSRDRRAAVRRGWLSGRSVLAQDGPTCRKELLGDPIDVEGQTCRIMSDCDEGTVQIKLACRGAEGDWRFEK